MIDQRYVKSDVRMRLLAEMETQYDNQNEQYFKDLLIHEDSVIRTRVICILADISGVDAVDSISRVLENDKNALVRHEAAFSLGQLGYTAATAALSNAVKSDPSDFVRHEAAIALGVIGSEDARETLNEALKDESEEVRESAIIALANLDYVSTIKRNNKFTRMTGG
ncbi:MAG: putative repeat-containing lyase [Nitrososphaeraceae archaeon]|jgi:deoxyhypusine monooxygenase|nr:putative repeat-containing lyase [Nitrososphaeraceae archaeon]MCD6036921.1 putative repeat-containing lyase [Nitrososphaeraceae archaeon]MDF2768380.1 putative repeat-containing lyase [Nitrososphaeraceae archaeon]